MSNFGNIPFPGIENAVLCSEYRFDASKQVVVCAKDISRFLVIVNGTDGITIFNPFNPATTGVVIKNKVTLTFDTSSTGANMSDTDDLYIYVERDLKKESEKTLAAAMQTAEATAGTFEQMRLLLLRAEEAWETGLELDDIEDDL